MQCPSLHTVLVCFAVELVSKRTKIAAAPYRLTFLQETHTAVVAGRLASRSNPSVFVGSSSSTSPLVRSTIRVLTSSSSVAVSRTLCARNLFYLISMVVNDAVRLKDSLVPPNGQKVD